MGDTWVWTPLTIQTPALSPGTVGVPYTATLHAAAGTAPYTWSVSSGALPTGLTLSGGGVISGTPTTAGTVTFTLKALDSSTPTAGQATRTLRIVVNRAPSAAVWVGNGANSAANAFPLTGNGNVLPAATLGGSLTALNGIGGLAFDATGHLSVASANSNAIEELASGASGNVAPIRVLQGPATQQLGRDRGPRATCRSLPVHCRRSRRRAPGPDSDGDDDAHRCPAPNGRRRAPQPRITARWNDGDHQRRQIRHPPRATTISFGRTRTPHVICGSQVRCTVHAPPGTAGTVHVTVTVGGLTSRPSQRDRYAYRR